MIKTECDCVPKIHTAHFISKTYSGGSIYGGFNYNYSDLIEVVNGFDKQKKLVTEYPSNKISEMEDLTKYNNAKCNCSELVDCKRGKCSCLSESIKKKLNKVPDIDDELNTLTTLYSEKKISESDYYKERLEKFKPSGPKGTDEWLNNFNIIAIMKQWMLKYPEFYSWGFSMNDFDEVDFGLGHPPLKEILSNGYTKIGCVVNTDTSKHRGEHWFAIYIDTAAKPPTVEYFDSANHSPSNNVEKFMLESARLLNGEIIKVAKIQHQQSKSECGIYSLLYIHSRLNNVPYKKFANNRISDDVVRTFRTIFTN